MLFYLLIPSLIHLIKAQSFSAMSELYAWDRSSYTYDESVPLVRSHPNALPQSILPYLLDEAQNTNVWEKSARSKTLKHSKAATNWTPMHHIKNPRTASEMAVALLFKLAFPNGELPDGGIAGGEWWVQLRKTNENIGFHVDKDEGVASEEQWMKMPILSTITYLTDEGAPTLILDQSSNRGGNVQLPELPISGVLVYPKKNRHVLFKGNLQHGVVGEFGNKNSGKQRVTFLVNWWDKKPIDPYCMSISNDVAENKIKTKLLKNVGLMSSVFGGDKTKTFWKSVQEEADQLLEDGISSETESFMDVDIPDGGTARRFDIQVPPTKRYNFPVPKFIDGKKYRNKIVQFDWDPSDVMGIVRKLALNNNMCMHLFNNVPGLKIIIFRDHKKMKHMLEFDLDVSYQVAKPYVDLEESTGTVIYTASVKKGKRDMLSFAKKTFAIKKHFPAVAAMLVTKHKKRKYFQMPGTLPIEPEVILNWIGKIETKQREVLMHEVRNGKLRKKKKSRRKRREEL